MIEPVFKFEIQIKKMIINEDETSGMEEVSVPTTDVKVTPQPVTVCFVGFCITLEQKNMYCL